MNWEEKYKYLISNLAVDYIDRGQNSWENPNWKHCGAIDCTFCNIQQTLKDHYGRSI